MKKKSKGDGLAEIETSSKTSAKKRVGDLDGVGQLGIGDVKAAFGNVLQAVPDATSASGAVARKAAVSAADGVRSSLAAGQEAASRAGRVAVESARVAGKVAADAAQLGQRSAVTVATTLFDQNDDGKVDQQDLKILTEKTARLTKKVAVEVGSSETVKRTATAAAIGAVIAVPVPVVGPVAGAVVGAFGSLAVQSMTKAGEAVGTAIGTAQRAKGTHNRNQGGSNKTRDRGKGKQKES